jgi:hypothetical protein
MRESVLRDLASQAATDPDFVRRVRRDPAGTLARHGYHLTDEEMRMVEDLWRQTSAMTTPSWRRHSIPWANTLRSWRAWSRPSTSCCRGG